MGDPLSYLADYSDAELIEWFEHKYAPAYNQGRREKCGRGHMLCSDQKNGWCVVDVSRRMAAIESKEAD